MLDIVMQIEAQWLRFLSQDNQPEPFNTFGEIALENINWDPCLEIINEWFDRIVTGLRIKKPADRTREFIQFGKELKMLREKAFDEMKKETQITGNQPVASGRAVGKIFISLLLAVYDRMKDAEDRTQPKHRNIWHVFRTISTAINR